MEIQNIKGAYLECGLTEIRATFPNEFVISFMNSDGNVIRACVDKGLVKIIGENKALVRVKISREYSNRTVLMHLYKGSAAFGNPPSENQIVGREQIIYEEEMKTFN